MRVCLLMQVSHAWSKTGEEGMSRGQEVDSLAKAPVLVGAPSGQARLPPSSLGVYVRIHPPLAPICLNSAPAASKSPSVEFPACSRNSDPGRCFQGSAPPTASAGSHLPRSRDSFCQFLLWSRASDQTDYLFQLFLGPFEKRPGLQT